MRVDGPIPRPANIPKSPEFRPGCYERPPLMSRLWTRYARATMPITNLVNRLGVSGVFLFAVLSLVLVGLLPYLFGAHGWAGSMGAVTVLLNPSARATTAVLGWYPLKLYGCAGDGVWNGGTNTFDGTNDTTQIQTVLNTINALAPQHGAVIYGGRASGVYRCTGTLTVNGAVGVTFWGQGSTADLGTAGFPGTMLAYVGTGSGEFLQCRNSYGTKFRDFAVVYTNSGFTGKLIDASNQGGSDTQFFISEGSAFGGIGVQTALCCISLWNAIFTWIDKSHVGGALHGIRGAEEVGAATGYSNVVHIGRTSFIRTQSAITNPLQSWTVDTCGFEGLQGGGSLYLKHAVSTDYANANPLVVNFTNNWCGDASGEQVWIKSKRGGVGGVYSGNFVSGGYGFIDGNPHAATPTVASGPLAVFGNLISINKVTNDAFGGSSLAGYTYDAGSGFTESGGLLVPNDVNLKRLYRTALNTWDRADGRNTIKFTPDATLTGTGFTGVRVKRLSASDEDIRVQLNHTTNPPTLEIVKRDGGADTTLNTPAAIATTLVNGSNYWLRGSIIDNIVRAEFWTTDPNTDSTLNWAVSTDSVTLAGGNATKFGSEVLGKPGLYLQAVSTGWRYDDHRMEGRNFSLDLGPTVLTTGVSFFSNSVDNGLWPAVQSGGLTTPNANGGLSLFSNKGNSQRQRWWLAARTNAAERRINLNVPTGTLFINEQVQEVYLQSSGGPITDIQGGYPGQQITLYADGTSKTISNSATILLNGTQQVDLVNGDSITLFLNDTGVWREVGRNTLLVAEGTLETIAIVGDTNFTYTPGTTARTLLFQTTLTNTRTLTLSTVGARKGVTCRVSRPAGGAFNLNCGTGPLKALAAAQWADFIYDGSAWQLQRFGSL